jgi:hypothetical protein
MKMSLLLTESFGWLPTGAISNAYGAWNNIAFVGSPTRTIEATGRNGNSFKLVPGTAGGDNSLIVPQGISILPTIAAGAVSFIGFAVKFVTIQDNANLVFFAINNDSGTATSRNNLTLIRSNAGVIVAGMAATTSSNNLTTTFATGSTVLSEGVWYYVEVKFQSHNSAGLCTVKVNGVQEFAATSLDTLNNNNNYGGGFLFCTNVPDAVTPALEYDDIYINDTAGSVNNDFLGDVTIKMLTPNGNGNSSQMVGSDADSTDNYLHVDDGATPTVDDDTSYVESATSSNKDTYAYSNLSGVASVKAVNIKTIGRKIDGGAADGIAVARSVATEADSAALGFTTSYLIKPFIRETDPDTSAAWAVAAVDAAEFGVKVA